MIFGVISFCYLVFRLHLKCVIILLHIRILSQGGNINIFKKCFKIRRMFMGSGFKCFTKLNIR